MATGRELVAGTGGARATMPVGGLRRLVWIDALRFFAILGVMVVHIAYAYPSIGRRWVLGLGCGRYGVDLFFAISGFLFGELMLGRSMERWRYLCRRGLRIGAVYYAAMLLYASLRTHPMGLRPLFLNIGFLNSWFSPETAYLVPGGWSICAEVFFYAAGVLLLPLLRNRRGVLACWVGSVAIAAVVAEHIGRPGWPDDFSPLMNLPTFIAGVFCWHQRDAVLPRPLAWTVSGLCLALTVVASVGVMPPPPRFVIGAICAVACWACIPIAEMPALAVLGRLSYSVYAFHFAVLDWALVIVIALLPVRASPWWSMLLVFALVFSGAFAIAWVVFRYLEQPVSRLLRGPSRPATPITASSRSPA